MLHRLDNITSTQVGLLLIIFTLGGLGVSAYAHIQTLGIPDATYTSWWDWADGAFQNFSTEMIGSFVTFLLFGLIERTRSTNDLKKRLVREVGSQSNETAKAAIDWLKHEGWFYGDDSLLNGTILVRANLSGADLGGGNMEAVDLRDANLAEANLWGANLENANLDKANLSRAVIVKANLENARLRRATLTTANLWDSHLRGAILRHANLVEANLTSTDLSGADLGGANLEGATLRNASLNDVKWVLEYDGGESAILPDGTSWTPDTDLSRFTDPDHPNFWQKTEDHESNPL